MPGKFLRWTAPGGEKMALTILPADTKLDDYSVMDAFASQNRVRHVLSLLQNTDFCGHPALPSFWDLKLTYDANKREYRLWVYTRNWASRASFLAGIVVGKAHKWRAKQRRLSRRKKRRQATA